MNRIRSLGLLLALAGCGGGAMDDGDGLTYCDDPALTVSFQVWPTELDRGEAVDIEIAWTVNAALKLPVVATLTTGPYDEIEVDVPLIEELSLGNDPVYFAVQLNPFGLGVPAGPVAVVAAARPEDNCSEGLSAVTSFILH